MKGGDKNRFPSEESSLSHQSSCLPGRLTPPAWAGGGSQSWLGRGVAGRQAQKVIFLPQDQEKTASPRSVQGAASATSYFCVSPEHPELGPLVPGQMALEMARKTPVPLEMARKTPIPLLVLSVLPQE